MGYTTEEEFESVIAKENEIETATPNTCDGAAAETVEEFPIKKGKICKKLHKCTYDGCDKSFCKPSRLLWHLRQHTGEKPYKCEFEDCDKSYTTSSHLKRHTRTHDAVQQSIKCHVCNLILKSRDTFRKHYQRAHNNASRISCNECGAVFRKKWKLDDHMAFHNNITSFKCEKCNKIFTSTYLLRKHEKSIHDRVLKCTENNCNEEFYRFIDLRVHRKNFHPKEYHCDQCEKCFYKKNALKQHMEAHQLSLLSCPYDNCSKIYSFQRNLQFHIRTKHMGEIFYCDMCGKGLSGKASLIRHIKIIHSLKRPKIKRRPKHGSERIRRKDAGLPHKSMVTKLIGLDLSHNIEKTILNRTPTIKLSDNIFEPVDSVNKDEINLK